jgi:hypothetical protein
VVEAKVDREAVREDHGQLQLLAASDGRQGEGGLCFEGPPRVDSRPFGLGKRGCTMRLNVRWAACSCIVRAKLWISGNSDILLSSSLSVGDNCGLLVGVGNNNWPICSTNTELQFLWKDQADSI